MKNISVVKEALSLAAPIMVGYLFLGIPCGILSQSVGMDVLQVFLLSLLFYSGAGQYMIPNMWLVGSPMAAIIASVTLVNSRQMLYSASLSRFCEKAGKLQTFLYGATVTDESFAVNVVKHEQGTWDIKGATLVNIFSQSSWVVANLLGVVVGSLLTLPTALASFAMTSIFLCLLFSQAPTKGNIVAGVVAVLGVLIAKSIGLSGPAILIGALLGVAAGMIVERKGRSSCHGVE
jgi:4-azaleucine resistance transporter AzlC